MWHKRKAGQGLAEYGLIIALVAIAAILALTLLGNTSSQVFSNVVCDVQGTVPSVFPNSPCAHLAGGGPSPTPTPSGNSCGSYSCTVEADAPQAYWRLDETGVANGSQGKDEFPLNGSAGPLGADPGTYNTNGGSISSGISPGAIVSGTLRGTAVGFTGGANMSAATLTALQGGNVRTVEVWFKSNNSAQTQPQRIFESGGVGAGNSMVISLLTTQNCCLEGGADINYNREYSQGLQVSFDTAQGAGYSVAIPKMNLADNVWHYLVVTLSGQNLNIYIDGVQPMGEFQSNGGDTSNGGSDLIQLQPFHLTFTPNTTTAGLDWGGNTLSGGRAFDGQLDEAAVYNVALSAAQVATHFASGAGVALAQSDTPYSLATANGDSQNGCPPSRITAGTCGPVAYWRLGDSGRVGLDSTGNDPGNYFGGPAYNLVPLGTYAQSTNSGSGSTNSTSFDSSNNGSTGGVNDTGSGLRVNTLAALQGDHSRTIKLWFQTNSQTNAQTLIGSLGAFGRGYSFEFNVVLLSPGGAGPGGIYAGVGGAPNGSSVNGGIGIASEGGTIFIPAPYSLADGHWHYLVVTVSGLNAAVYIDNTASSGYECCPNNAWTPLTASPQPFVNGAPNSPAADITIGYDMQGGAYGPTIGDWFKGQMQDVAIFDYALNAQQISHEWGKAHPNAQCSNLLLANVNGNADGGVFGNQNGPVSGTATQTCDTVGSLGLTGNAGVPSDPTTVLADNYVTFYWALEKHVGNYSPACYSGLSAASQISWIGGAGPWVYCYPGGYPGPDPNAQQIHPYTVTAKIGSSSTLTPCNGTPFPGGQTICFYQGQDLTPCTVTDANGNIGPLYFIQAQNAYAVASPVPVGSGIPLNASQSAAAGGTINGVPTGLAVAENPPYPITEGQHGTAMSQASNGGPVSTAAWGISGPTAESRVVGQCVPAPGEKLYDRPYAAPRPYGGDPVPDGFAPWAAATVPFILITPFESGVGVNSPQAYTATAYQANGVAIGDVTSSTALTVSGSANCSNVSHSCQAAVPGDYIVTGTYGSEQASAALHVSTTLTYAQTVLADRPLIYYQLDGGAPFVDSGSLNHPATDVNSNVVTGGSGIDGNSVALNGNSQITFDATGTPTTGARTIEMWVKTTDANRRNIFYYGAGGTLGPGGLLMEMGNTAGGSFRLFTGGQDLNWNVSLADGRWHMIDVTYDGSNLASFYKDGGLIATYPVGALNIAGTTANLGGAQFAAPMNSNLDEFAMYGSQLSSGQVAAHYEASTRGSGLLTNTTYSNAVNTNNPVVYYRFGDSNYTYRNYGSANEVATSLTDNVTSNLAVDGNGLTFAGNDGITFDSSSLPSSGARTVEMWLKNTDGNRRNVLYYGSGTGAQGFLLEINNNATGGLRILANNADYNSPNIGLTDGNWHLIDVLYDGSNMMTLYRDGAQIATFAVGQLNTSLGTGNVNVAGSAYAAPYAGSMDELAIYGSQLSGGAIVNHYCASSVASCALALAPGNASQLAGTAVTYTATRSSAGGSLGTITATLSITPNGGATGATCNQGLQTCQATQLGNYNVNAVAPGGLTANATLHVVAGPLSYSQVVTNDAPTSYWRLNDASGTTAVDSSGNGHDGTYIGGWALNQAPPAVTGGGGAAKTTSGSGQYVTAAAPTASNWTYEAWVNHNGNAWIGNHEMVISGTSALTNGDGTGNYLDVYQGNLFISVQNVPGGNQHYYNTGVAVPTSGWHYLVVTWNGATLTAYMDGTQVYTQSPGAVGSITINSVAIGAYRPSDGIYQLASGTQIEEAAIYNYALSGSQVSAHYAAR